MHLQLGAAFLGQHKSNSQTSIHKSGLRGIEGLIVEHAWNEVNLHEMNIGAFPPIGREDAFSALGVETVVKYNVDRAVGHKLQDSIYVTTDSFC